MDHNYFKDKLSAYFDGALEAQERELIRRHLNDCHECRKHLEELKRLSSTIEKYSGLSGDEYFENLAKKIDSRIGRPVEKVVNVKSFRWKSVVWKLSAAAASILLIGTISYYQWFRDDELKDRVRESAQTPIPEQQIATDDKPETVGEFEKGTENAGGEGAGGRKEDLNKRKIANEEGFASSADKMEAESPDIVKRSPESMAIVMDSISINNAVAPKEPAPAVVETKELVGKTKQVDTIVYAYRARQDSQSAGALDDRDMYEMEFADTAELDLEELRTQNTFLQSQVDQTKNREFSLGIAEPSKKLARSNLKPGAETTVPDSIYQQLAVSWYQIGQITKDSTEKDQAIQYLNWYKSNFPMDSVNTNQYLKEISPKK